MCSTPEQTTFQYASASRPKTLRRTALAVTLAVGAVVGCMPPGQRPNEPVNTTPVVVDEAMDRRDWEPTTAYYANGDTYGGHTRFWAQEPGRPRPVWQQIVIDPFLFIGQVAYLPFTYFTVPPFEPKVTQGQVIAPTHYGVPPVPELEPAPPVPPPVSTLEFDDRDRVSDGFPESAAKAKPEVDDRDRVSEGFPDSSSQQEPAQPETETAPAVQDAPSADLPAGATSPGGATAEPSTLPAQ
jgi:hypothetical protein